jgi:hypothetical protein
MTDRSENTLSADLSTRYNRQLSRRYSLHFAGGVSDLEHGWRLDNDPAHGRATSEEVSPAKGSDSDAASIRSVRSRRSRFGRAAQTVQASSWNERLVLHDWKPPMMSTVTSRHNNEVEWGLARTDAGGRRWRKHDRRGRGATADAADGAGAATVPARTRRGWDVRARLVGAGRRTDGRFVHSRDLWVSTLGRGKRSWYT